MNPEFSPRPNGPEQGQNFNQQPGGNFNYNMPPNFENQENFEQRQAQNSEQYKNPAELVRDMPAQPIQQVVPSQVAMPQVQRTVIDPRDSNPVTASDSDVIEKEWVDRAKQILAKTQNNPRARELAIGALQRDYLKKRYGKELRSTNN